MDMVLDKERVALEESTSTSTLGCRFMSPLNMLTYQKKKEKSW